MRFRNPAKRTWSTSWTRSTGLEASCSFHWTQILWQGFWISPPLKPQLFHNKRQNSTKVFTHPAQAEDMQWVRELSSRLVFSNSAAFTLDREKSVGSCGVWPPVICWKVPKIHQGCSLQLQDEKRNLEPFPKPAHLASSPSTAPRYHLEPQFSWEKFKT